MNSIVILKDTGRNKVTILKKVYSLGLFHVIKINDIGIKIPMVQVNIRLRK